MKKYIVLLFAFCFSIITSGQSAKKSENGINNHGITKIILLRHAEKGNDGSNNPELTFKGEERAKRLAFLLEDIKIDKIFATPFIRTEKTVAILASNKGITVAQYDAKDQSFAASLLEKGKDQTIVVVGHSNSIPFLANKLIGKDSYKELSENEYGKLWVLTFSDATLIDCSVFNY